MTDEPRQRRRRGSKRSTALVPGRPAIQQAYHDLADQLFLLSWSVPAVFAERERDAWERIVEVGIRRGLPTAPLHQAAAAQPVEALYRSGSHQRYRDLSAAVSALADAASETISDEERDLWQRLWAFGVTRGTVESINQ
jgi:hypothetical protein